MGRASRNKGNRFEREIVHLLQEAGIAAEKVPLSGAAGGSYSGDISCPILGIDRKLECKVRSHGFASLYGWLTDNYGLVVKQDRAEPLVVLRLKDFAALAITADECRLWEKAAGQSFVRAEQLEDALERSERRVTLTPEGQ